MQRRPLRIACVSERMDPEWVWLRDKVNYHHPLSWVFFRPSPTGIIDKLAGRPLLGRVLEGLRLRRAVTRGEIDIIFSHGPYCSSWMATLLGKAKGRVFHFACSFNFTDLPKGLRRWHMARSFRGVDRFFVFASMERTLYGEYFGIPTEKFERVVWGVAPPIDQPGPRQIEAPYVVSLGGEARDYPTLIEVARAMKDTNFVLIVRPWSLSGFQLPPNIKVFTNIPWAEAWSLVYHSALAVIPLRSSTTPNGLVTLVGGMHLGKAHVVTASSGLAEYVTPNETALAVPARDPASVQAAVEQLLLDRELAKRIGNAAKIFAHEHCSEDVSIKFLVGLFDRIFNEKNA